MINTIAAVVPGVDEAFSLRTVQVDDPRPHEVLVRMTAVGLCHTDLSVRHGLTPFPLPGVLGHEGAGVVEAVGNDVRDVRPGDHVLLSFTSCGHCRSCRDEHPSRCDRWGELNLFSGRRGDGSARVGEAGAPLNAGFFGQSSFAEYAAVDERCLVAVAPDLPLDVLAPLGCGIQTGFGTVVNVLQPPEGTTLAVFGAGAVGLAAVMAAKLQPLDRVIVVDRVEERLALAGKLGATDLVDAGSADVPDALRDLTGGRGPDFAIEATGNTGVLEQAIGGLAPAGACAVVGAPRTGATVSVDVKFLMRSRRLVGVTEGDSNPPDFIPKLIDRYRDGQLPLEEVITHYPFARIEDAARDAKSGTTIKPVLLF
jgi:aryl-alcohol dehydrogenase